MDGTKDARVAEAELQCAAILAQLETETGCLVEGLRLHGIDVTGLSNNRQQLLQSVVISLRRVPGHEWG